MPVICITALFVTVAFLINRLLPHSPTPQPEDETEDEWLDRQW